MSLLASSEAARNYLLVTTGTTRRLLLKIRADPHASAASEAVALARAGPVIAPQLLDHLTLPEIMERAVARRDLAAISALELDLGDCLVMARLPGEPLEPPVSDTEIDRVAEQLARLRLRPRRGLPRLGVSGRPSVILHDAEERIAEIRRRRLVDPETAAAFGAARRRVAAQLDRYWRQASPRRVAAFCHGDLRWHNLMRYRDTVRLVDFEHAGIGDPAVDLAMMVNRTPLSKHDELRLLDAYLGRIRDRGFLDRYFAVRPAVALLGATEAILDLAEAHRDRPAMAMEPGEYARRRAPHIEAEVHDALAICLAPRRRQLVPKLRFEPRRQRRRKITTLITVDGTAGALKSVIAAELAAVLGVSYFDTGTAYRYAALWAFCHRLQAGVAADQRRLVRHLKRARLTLMPDGSLWVGGRRLSRSLHTAAVETTVASWARCPAVREALSPVWRPATGCRGAVVEGRDVGTRLAPWAPFKLYIDAPLAVRGGWLAARLGCGRARAERLVAQRDALDRTRAVAPLVPAPDAIRIDPSREDPAALVRRLATRIQRRC